MNILVTGAGGQLGKIMQEESQKYKANNNDKWFFCGHNELDIADYRAVENFLIDNFIDVVINCAAYTDVEKAESEVGKAEEINTQGPRILADICKKTNALLIHLSTDFVFNGMKNTPYTTEDGTCPLSTYGYTKLEGERYIKHMGCSYIIVRTSWLYSEYGNNFLNKMIKLIKDENTTKRSIVIDQIGTPTYARDLADVLIRLISFRNTGIKETLHYSNEGVCSWYDFAKAIEEEYNRITEKNIDKFSPCYSNQFITKAQRPSYSVLDKSAIKELLDVEVPYWKDSLKKCMKNIVGPLE